MNDPVLHDHPAAHGRERQAGAALPAVLFGSIVGTTPSGEPLVLWDGVPRPVRARCVWLPVQPDWDRCMGLVVCLGFLGGDATEPVIVGLMSPPTVVNGGELPRQVRIEASEELVLECGRARLGLRADGKVSVHGEHLLSRATVTNKVQGGSVQIN